MHQKAAVRAGLAAERETSLGQQRGEKKQDKTAEAATEIDDSVSHLLQRRNLILFTLEIYIPFYINCNTGKTTWVVMWARKRQASKKNKLAQFKIIKWKIKTSIRH